MQLSTQLITKNPCYTAGRYMTPKGIVVHSTACNQTNPYVFYKSWNNSSTMKAVHAFIGANPDDKSKAMTLQMLPWKMRCWGCGQGRNGSWNDNRIQFEICEDKRANKEYLLCMYEEAVDLCAHLCFSFNIQTSDIHAHCEGYKMGYASNHSDVDHWFKPFGLTMDQFRADVKKRVVAIRYDKTLTDAELLKKVNVIGTPSKYTQNTSTVGIRAGSKVRVKQGAVDLNSGRKYSDFVYQNTYIVKSVSGTRVVFTDVKGNIIGATLYNNLQLIL